MSRPILVVGASGPLGRAIITDLEAHSHEIEGTSRSGEKRLDFTDLAAARSVLESIRPKIVVHLARPDADRPDADSLGGFASLCTELGVERFIFASSSAVYGTDAPEPRSESDNAKLPTPYARLKYQSERILTEIAGSTGMSAVSLRIFNVYGPGFTGSLVNRLALGDKPSVYMTDSFVRDYVHSSDVARAFRLAAEAELSGSLVLNVGTGSGTSNRAVLDIFPGAPYKPLPGDGIRSFSVADISRIERLWGFAPTITIADVNLLSELVH